MIPKYLSVIWAAIAPALGNHLWQSTLCLVIAGLLTLTLRKNRARARYGVWLAASVKFLIPFSLLVNAGSHLMMPRVLPPAQPGFLFAMEQVSQPFTPLPAHVISPAVHFTTPGKLVDQLPAILVAMWFCGFVAVLFVWSARWRRVFAATREAVPLQEGREVDALRRVERLLGVRKPIDLLLSPATLEPGIFGIVNPALVWPKGISARLDNAQMEAILAHEAWHVRRRDNLAAAIHMVVEALFWFHPLVWWLGSRLLEEREHACDEKVLELGSDRQVYAESILKTCEFYVESPLACVSGVTSSDLKRRMVRIMTERLADRLGFGRKLLLAAIGIAAVAGPVIFGLVNTPPIRGQSQQSTGAPRGAEISAGIIARVNNEIITQGTYDQEKEKLRVQLSRQYSGAELETQFREQSKNVLRNLIDQSLMVQKAKDESVNVETDLIKRLDQFRKQDNLATIEDLQKDVEQQGVNWEAFKEQIRRQLMMQEVVNREVGSRITMSREDERKYYEARKDEFKTPGMVRLGQVLISTEKRKSEEAEKRANDALAELKAGQHFADVAKKYSDGSSAEQGGDMGFMEEGGLAPDIKSAVAKLDVSEFSNPIRIKRGYMILELLDRHNAGIPKFEEVENRVTEVSYEQSIQPHLREYLTRLRSESHIFRAPGYVDTGEHDQVKPN